MYKGKRRLFYRRLLIGGCCGALLCGGCRPLTPSPTPSPTPSTEEMRGVWLSYIELDEMLTDATPDTAAQRIAAAMERCRRAGLNTVFFHLRAHGDAYFPSTVWPTATAARAVIAAGFDPLACAVEEARKQGLQIHGWINPYRIGSIPAADATCFEKSGTWYYAPCDSTARQRILDGVRDVLSRYAVDGIHVDDYFYPTGMASEGEPFEEIPRGTDVTLWRQTQVDALVSGIYGLCRAAGKPFGISPMADIRRCETTAYATVTRWMTEGGYIDYVCPQLYTGFRHQTRPFSALLAEWVALPRRNDVALYIGLAQYKVGLSHDPYAGSGADEWRTDQDIIPRQIATLLPVADGYVLFRYAHLTI